MVGNKLFGFLDTSVTEIAEVLKRCLSVVFCHERSGICSAGVADECDSKQREGHTLEEEGGS